jgi:hypothetical protein
MGVVRETGENRLDPVTLVGYLIYIGLLTAGYYYNLTFVQLGLIDLGSVGRYHGVPQSHSMSLSNVNSSPSLLKSKS